MTDLSPFPRNDNARCASCVKKSFDEEDLDYYRCSAVPNWPKIDRMWLVVHWCHLGTWWVRLGDSPPWLASMTDISANHEVLVPGKDGDE